MAVMVAEAVAAGYLADVEGGLDPAAALQSAAAFREGSSRQVATLVGGGRGDGAAAAGPANPTAALSAVEGGPVLAAGRGSPRLPSAEAAARGGGESSSSSGGGGSGLVPLEASYWPTFTHRQLSSTRQLQRFTNQARRCLLAALLQACHCVSAGLSSPPQTAGRLQARNASLLPDCRRRW